MSCGLNEEVHRIVLHIENANVELVFLFVLLFII